MPLFLTVILPPIIAFCIALFLTGWIRRYALSRELLDHPNQRSSHSQPTPRGGGLAIVVTVLAYVIVAGILGQLDWSLAIGLVGGGAMVAGIGWADDVRSTPASLRLIVHFAAASWAVAWIGGFPSLDVGVMVLGMGFLGSALGVIAIVWAINLFNFMDGIDGIAGVEAVCMGALSGLLFLLRDHAPWATLSFVVAAAAAGFLKWNWAPAKIFMGDVGSGFLGFLFGSLAVASERAGTLPFLVWVILFAAFVIDATVTLLRRIPLGAVGQAHRSHAYQRAVQAGLSHSRVALGFALFNVFLGIAALVAVKHVQWMVATLLVATVAGVGMYVVVERRQPFHPDNATR